MNHHKIGGLVGPVIKRPGFGRLKAAHLNRAEAIAAWSRQSGQGPGDGQIGIELIAFADQGLRILEILQHDLPAQKGSAIGKMHGEFALVVDRETCQRRGGSGGLAQFREADVYVSQSREGAIGAALHARAIVGYQVALGIQTETADLRGVACVAGRVAHYKKAVAQDG